MIEALIGAGVKPDVRDAEGKTALINATESYSGCDAGKAETAPAMAALIRLGADVNAVDDKGETALFGLEEPALQELLLAAGARIDIRAKDGTTALESSWDDRTALGLLDAGAIPGGKDDDGKTLRQIATEHDMPATLAWLDAHQIK
jgi:ankyrin repeat protein